MDSNASLDPYRQGNARLDVLQQDEAGLFSDAARGLIALCDQTVCLEFFGQECMLQICGFEPYLQTAVMKGRY